MARTPGTLANSWRTRLMTSLCVKLRSWAGIRRTKRMPSLISEPGRIEMAADNPPLMAKRMPQSARIKPRQRLHDPVHGPNDDWLENPTVQKPVGAGDAGDHWPQRPTVAFGTWPVQVTHAQEKRTEHWRDGQR